MVQYLSFFPDLPATYIIGLTSMVLLLFQHSFLPISMWKPSIFPGEVGPRVASSMSHYPSSLPTLGSTLGCICWLPHILINVNFITLEKMLPPGALGLNAFNHPWKFQVSYAFPSTASIPLVLSKFLLEHVTNQFRFLFQWCHV